MASTLKHVIDSNSSYRDGSIYNDYDCTLNQTDIKTNKNKFYIMQIIEKGSQTVIFIRYGRVGEKGKISESAMSATGCISKFETQFKSKTGNAWSSRSNFVAKKGKYYMCQMDYEDVVVAPVAVPVASVDGTIATPKAPAVCSLTPKVQEFLSLVGDVKEMNKTLVDLNIDTKKMPLGKLSQSQIDKGYAILNKITLAMKGASTPSSSDTYDITDLSSEYYTLIPYVSDRRSRPPVINTVELIQKYTETLDELSNITVGAKIVQDSTGANACDVHPLDAIYKEIKTDIKAVEPGSATWKLISDYITNTHGNTHGHTNYSIDLLEIYEIQRSSERETYEKQFAKFENRQLLWHGTRLSNYISILKNGLLLRPDVIPGTYISGKMFGYGIYAANSFSKSFNYTGADRKNPVACLFLGEFALGKTNNLTGSDYYISKESLKQKNLDSTWGLGRNTPGGFTTMDDGVIVPNGKLSNSNVAGASLLYDEFIVYDQNQLNLRFIVKVKGNFK